MLSGVVLAGGQNRRMNSKMKAMLPFKEGTLVERQISRMRTVCDEVIVVTNDPKPFLRLLDESVRLITDYIPGKGPLSGIHAALALASNADVWVVGCDMPFLSPEAAKLLQEHKEVYGYEAVIPAVNGGIYPLHGIYDRGCAEKAATLLHTGETRLSMLLKQIYWGEAPEFVFAQQNIDLRFVFTIKTPDDYQNALKMEEGLSSVG